MRDPRSPTGTASLATALRDAGRQPAVESALALALAAFYVVTGSNRTAFGVPFLLLWAALVTAFFVGWNLTGERLAGVLRRRAAAFVAVAGIGAVSALAWYLVSRRLLGAERSPALWAAGILASFVLIGAAVAWRTGERRQRRWLLPIMVIASWVALRGYLLVSPLGLYDFEVYLGGGIRWLQGGQPYLTEPLSALPASAIEDVFLYPPPLLPVFGALSLIPRNIVDVLWVCTLLLAAVPALRLLGMRWPWVAGMMLFSPLIRGVDAGNVANITFLIFAAAPMLPALLPVGILFKPQLGIPSLWLLRERRLSAIVGAAAALAVIFVVTLPFVGLGSWLDWAASLGHREASQRALPVLYGWSLAQYLPLLPFAAIALAAILVPFFLTGTRSLAGFGLATIIAAPSLWLHGFVFAMPALLALDAPLVWFALGTADGPWLWIVVAAGYVGLFLGRWDRAAVISDPIHPLVGTRGPWDGRAADAAAASPGPAEAAARG